MALSAHEKGGFYLCSIYGCFRRQPNEPSSHVSLAASHGQQPLFGVKLCRYELKLIYFEIKRIFMLINLLGPLLLSQSQRGERLSRHTLLTFHLFEPGGLNRKRQIFYKTDGYCVNGLSVFNLDNWTKNSSLAKRNIIFGALVVRIEMLSRIG